MRLAAPVMGEEELEAVAEVLRSGNLTQGPKAAEFGNLVANYVGTRFGYPTSSCTTALHLALVALGVKAGDEVVLPGFTFPATANVVIQLGAVPVLADIDIRTYCLAPSSFEDAVTDRTKAVIPVHAFGLSADMEPIVRIAGDHGIFVVEDAACALGSKYHGRMAGSMGDVGCFSFHPRKILTTGEGGAITTNNSKLHDDITLLSSHGGRRGELYLDFEEAGFNYRLSDINAAIGVVQMARLDNILNKRRALAKHYQQVLELIPAVTLPCEPEGLVHTFQSYVVLLDAHVDRDEVIRFMRNRNIEVTLGTYALNQQSMFDNHSGATAERLPNSDLAGSSTLTLPLHSQMESFDVEEVALTLSNAIASQV